MHNIAIIDYNAGNLHSLYKNLSQYSVNVKVVSGFQDFKNIDKVIMPGVGHFGTAIKKLNQASLTEALTEFALVQKRPVLGICLGMQLMANTSEEDSGSAGLGWIPATVKKLSVNDTLNYKVPHMGWNTLSVEKQSRLMYGIGTTDEFYFVHSYHMCDVPEYAVLNKTCYEYPFVSAIEHENIFAVQYHPEKSHTAGLTLLQNFMNI